MKFIYSFAMVMLLCTTVASCGYSQTTDTTVTVKVKGITCATDLKMIQANVEKLDGVSTCEIGKQGTTTSFNITFDPEIVSEKDLYAAIEGTGSCEHPNERPYKVKQ